MKVFCFFIAFLVILNSCHKQEKETNKNIVVDTSAVSKSVEKQKDTICSDLDSIKDKMIASKASSDTVKYHFSLEDVGTEGNAGVAYYLNNRLQKVKMDIYTSMWETNLLYIFNNTNIIVTQRTYNIYKKKELVKEFSYKMDFKGMPLEKVESDRIDIFPELEKTIPFNLSKARQ